MKIKYTTFLLYVIVHIMRVVEAKSSIQEVEEVMADLEFLYNRLISATTESLDIIS